MLTGFFRLKHRTTRRPGFEREGRVAHLRRRIPEVLALLRSSARLMLEMEELWLATRRVGETETLVLEELARIRSGMGRRLRVSELRAAYLRAKAQSAVDQSTVAPEPVVGTSRAIPGEPTVRFAAGPGEILDPDALAAAARAD